MKIKTLYHFNVIDELKSGSDIRFVDRLNCTNKPIKNMSVEKLFECLSLAEIDELGIYEFYKIEKEVTENEQ